jgi:hypothetical protein
LKREAQNRNESGHGVDDVEFFSFIFYISSIFSLVFFDGIYYILYQRKERDLEGKTGTIV